MVPPWNIPGHSGPAWSYDYLEAEDTAFDACMSYHAQCAISTCYEYSGAALSVDSDVQ